MEIVISIIAASATLAAAFAAFFSWITQKKIASRQYLSDIIKLYSSKNIGLSVKDLFGMHRELCKRAGDNPDIILNRSFEQTQVGLEIIYKQFCMEDPERHWRRRKLSNYLQYLMILIEKREISKKDIVNYFGQDFLKKLIILIELIETKAVPSFIGEPKIAKIDWIDKYKLHFPFIKQTEIESKGIITQKEC